jgi:hypothetical protein
MFRINPNQGVKSLTNGYTNVAPHGFVGLKINSKNRYRNL